MKLTSIMRLNSAASDFANGADSAMPALAIRISIGCALGGFRNRGADGGLIGDIGDGRKMRGAGSDRPIQRRAIAAEHRDGGAGLRQRGGDREADAAAASGDQRMRGNAAVRTCAMPPLTKPIEARIAYILDFKLWQETAPRLLCMHIASGSC